MDAEKEKSQKSNKSDVKERDNIYVVEIEMENFAREEINSFFHDGYLVVTACKENESENIEEFKKAFYVGKTVAQENIRAAFNNGILKFMIPKDEKKESQEPTDIEIL